MFERKLQVSQRGKDVIGTEHRNDMTNWLRIVKDAYHPESNPDGYLIMAVAENNYLKDHLNKKMKESLDSEKTFPPWYNNYAMHGHGHESFRSSLANMMAATCYREVDGIRPEIDPEYLIAQASCHSVMDSVAYATAEANDCFIIPSPMYMSFKWGLAKARVHVEPAPCEHTDFIPTKEVLQAAYTSALDKGRIPKAVLISNPNNPTGVMYTAEQLEVIIDFCEKKKIFLFSDEIYGNSIFEDETFVSVAHVMKKRNPESERYLGDHVVIISGLGKSWCMAGFRVGWYFSHNEELSAAVRKMCTFSGVGLPTQHVINCAFKDEDYVLQHYKLNRAALTLAYNALKEVVEECGLKITEAKGSLLAWIDFRSLMPELTFEWERKIRQSLEEDAKMLFCGGEDCWSVVPGFLRITYMCPAVGDNNADYAIRNALFPRLKKWVVDWSSKHNL